MDIESQDGPAYTGRFVARRVTGRSAFVWNLGLPPAMIIVVCFEARETHAHIHP